MKKHRGQLFVLDGPSAAGKTTLALKIAESRTEFDFVKRYTTRLPRNAESENDEYIFIDPPTFSKMVEDDRFIEYRHYKFGMSYGIPWDSVNSITGGGRNAIGIINLDRVQVLKSRLPEAIAILIDVDPLVLKQRLIARGANTEEQIAERLESARAVDYLRPYYDHIVRNDGDLFASLANLETIISQHVGRDE
jgi:guanylate kinase